MTYRQHISIAALLNGGFGLLSIGLGVLLALGRAGQVPLPPADDRLLVALEVMSFVHGLLAVLVGWGIYHLRPWARVLGIVFGVLALTSPVVGAAFGVYTLWVLLSEGGARVFTEQGQVHLYSHASGFGGVAQRPAADEPMPPCSCILMALVWGLIHVLCLAPVAVMHGPDPRAWPVPTPATPPADPATPARPGAPAAPGEAAPPTLLRRVQPVEGLPGHYSYRDEQGRLFIVDDFDDVPERYR